MDVLGGAGICRGPNNLVGNGYMGLPIAITVEGANILTRSMITFGQGLNRGAPFARHSPSHLAYLILLLFLPLSCLPLTDALVDAQPTRT